MTADEFREIRTRLGMDRNEFARALGYEGSESTNFSLIKRIENGKRPVMPATALKAIELDRARPSKASMMANEGS
jgi:transcriptional regulator with XRE-family HTH domain